MSKEIANVFMFRSDSNPNQTYETLQYIDGTTSCTCKGWIFRRRSTPDGERTCKHTRLIDARMAAQVAIKTVEYLPVAAQPRRIAAKATQIPLTPKKNRVLYLDTL